MYSVILSVAAILLVGGYLKSKKYFDDKQWRTFIMMGVVAAILFNLDGLTETFYSTNWYAQRANKQDGISNEQVFAPRGGSNI
jgi:hypothetical protein